MMAGVCKEGITVGFLVSFSFSVTSDSASNLNFAPLHLIDWFIGMLFLGDFGISGRDGLTACFLVLTLNRWLCL